MAQGFTPVSRSDVSLEGTGDMMSEPAEHVRYGQYLHAFAHVSGQEELVLVSAVLGDPDQAMAQSAVVWYLDQRAAALHRSPEFPAWAQRLNEVVDRYPFVVQRLHEWSLYRAIAEGGPWDPDAVLAASDWLQRKIAESLSSMEGLQVLVDGGRTRRVRNIAETRLNARRR